MNTLVKFARISLVDVLDWVLTRHAFGKLLQWLCHHSTSGHHFTVDLLTADDMNTYVIDPIAVCRRCEAPMRDEVYASLVEGYTRFDSMELEEEDDLW